MAPKLNALKKKISFNENELIKSKDWLFYFLLIWTVIIIAFQIYEFLGELKTSHEFHTAYIILLAAYITHKEINRWIGLRMKIRYGEFFVIIWWGLLLAMFLLIQFSGNNYYFPEEMLSTSYHVLGAFIIAEISKAVKTYKTKKICEKYNKNG